jgi:Tol biopolymer transport system component
MRNLLFLACAAGCVPPGYWATMGNTSGSTTGSATPGAPAQPALSPQLATVGAARQLQRLTADDQNNETEVQPSPDGRWLLYTSTVPTQDENARAANRIVHSRSDGRGDVMLTSEAGYAMSPSWLPGGTSYVAVSDAMGGTDIVRVLKVTPHAASSRVLSGRDLSEPGGVQVSPDGSHIAFHSTISGAVSVSVARIDGSELTTLGAGAWPSWSPDGKHIAFHRQVGDQVQLFVTDIEGGELTQVTDGADDEFPTWSPDGRMLAFASNRGWQRYTDATASSAFNLYVVQVDGSGLTALTEGAHNMLDPRWARAGHIYFASNTAGSYDVWRLEVDLRTLASAQ